MNKKQYSLCEAVADIAYMAGQKQFSTGDSREDIALFIQWAVQFEQANEGVVWDVDKDYIETITDFAEQMMICPLHILFDSSYLITE